MTDEKVVDDRYELEELVGTGGMSSVYRAHDRLLERKVALKILHQHYREDPEYVERFRREARSVAGLSHPNIVTVIDRGEEDGSQFIVFEYIDGENLKAFAERSGPLPVETALPLALQVARGLSFAHQQGLVHRDVKPQNVLLNGEGQAKVTDFGIARSIDVKHGLTQTGTVLGTSDYIAPEQAQGLSVDAQTDVYSLGVVIYELLTGEVPFPGENFVAVAMRHINEPPPSVRDRRGDVSPRLDAAVVRAMAKDPGDRYASMDDFCRELSACLEEVGAPTGGHETVVRAPVVARPRAQRGSPWPIALLVLAAALLAAVAVAFLVQGGKKQAKHVAPRAPVHLAGTTAFDPFGSNKVEHDADAPKATDRDPGSYWTTEHYNGGVLGKQGVGLVLDAGRIAQIERLGVVTDTPGFQAVVRAGSSPHGPWHDVSASQTVAERTQFVLRDARARFFEMWITRLGGGYDAAHVNEVLAS